MCFCRIPLWEERLYDLDKKIFFTSRDVVFCESTFPFSQSIPAELSLQAVEPPVVPTNDEVLSEDSSDSVSAIDADPNNDMTLHSSVSSSPEEPVVSSSSPDILLGRGHRSKLSNNRLRDYLVGTVSVVSSSESSVPQLSSGTNYPLSHYISDECFSEGYWCYLTAITTAVEPKSSKEAMSFEEWRQAMKAEIDSIEDNHTWYLQELPPGKTLIGSQWVFLVKFNADGTIERHKARVVALGNHQKEGLDYKDTFHRLRR